MAADSPQQPAERVHHRHLPVHRPGLRQRCHDRRDRSQVHVRPAVTSCRSCGVAHPAAPQGYPLCSSSPPPILSRDAPPSPLFLPPGFLLPSCCLPISEPLLSAPCGLAHRRWSRDIDYTDQQHSTITGLFIHCPREGHRRMIMARAIWKGAISFGLVHIPVSLISATTSQRIDFDWLDERTMEDRKSVV